MQLHDEVDKLAVDVEHLRRIVEDESPAAAELGVSIAKRVRRASTILLRVLAERRDNPLQPGGTSA